MPWLVGFRPRGDRPFPWRLIRPQLVAMTLLAAAAVIGMVRLWLGLAPTAQGTWINLVWVVYDLVVLSVIIQAARYTGPAASTSSDDDPSRAEGAA